MSDIEVIKLGMVNVYLIKGDGYILVDTGMKISYKKILKTLERLQINPEDIKLIVLTHGHEDHIGSLDVMIKKTGAKVLIHQLEYDCLKNIINDDIKPLMWLAKLIFILASPRLESKFDTHIDILMEDEYDLSEYGISGKLIHTPGHSKGSISILLDDGNAIIGDSLMAMMPWSKPSKPILAYDLGEVKSSMNKLIDLGATHFYLSHGKSYDVDIIRYTINKI